MGKASCKRCIYLVEAAGRGKSVSVCTNKYGRDGRLILFEQDSPCRNYQAKRTVERPVVCQPQDCAIRFIPLTKGKFAIVDAEDYQWLIKYRWYCVIVQKSAYAYRNVGNKTTGMHRIIMKAPRGMFVDHIDGNGLNNTRRNLRICTPGQNNCNSKGVKKTSRYKGVCRPQGRRKWFAQIRYRRKNIRIGRFGCETAAARAYDRKAKELFGEFAYLNFPDV